MLEQRRIMEHLSAMDPTTETYRQGLLNLGLLLEIEHDHPEFSTEVGLSLAPMETIANPAEEAQAPFEGAPWEEAQAPSEGTPGEEPVKTYTALEIRTVLSEASAKGLIDLKALMAKYIPEGMPVKLSSIPESAYADIVKEVEALNAK